MKVKSLELEESENDSASEDILDSDEGNQSENSFDEDDSFEPGEFVRKRPRDDEDSHQNKKKRIKKNNELYKPPTAEELSQLRETENLFHSNLFRLQIEEILTEVKLKDKYKKLFDTWFIELKKNIRSISETKERELTRKKSLKKLEIEVPDLDVPINQKGTYRFLKPSNISPIGSYTVNTTVGPDVIVDVMVEMPSALFQKHDYQDYRYMRKRSIYLSYIAANLSDSLIERKKFFGESYMPKLKIIPSGALGKRVTVHIHIAAEKGSFKLSRFSPEKNSVRPNWFFNSNNDPSEVSALPPTPHYNSNILHDLTMGETNTRASKVLKEYPNLRDGIILLKIWLFQRQPEKSYEGFNGHILMMYVLHLLYEKRLNTFMSSYQIVRNVWNNLVQTNWSETGITMCPDLEAKSRVSEYQKYYDCVFLDSTGHHNLAANISIDNYLWIRSEAEVAVKSLDNASINSFQVLFMRRLPFYSIFDHFVCFHDVEGLKKLLDGVPDEKKVDLGVHKRSHVINLIVNILKKGLGRRVSQLYVKPEDYKEWELTEKIPSHLNRIFIGFQLNPEFCFNILDKGPEANAPEAADFRKLWGNKSELRRFQDGSICEAVVWNKSTTISEKRMITKQIVMFLLKSQLDISKSEYFYAGDQIDEFLKYRKTKLIKFPYGTGEEATLQTLQVFNSLEKELTGLTELPLSITGVQGISPVFRYTDVFPPLATGYKADEDTEEGENCLLLKETASLEKAPTSARAIEGVIQLSASGKWPDELEAVRMTKTAFHIQIAECVRKSLGLRAKGNCNYVDILKDGFVFRLSVAHQREIALMKQQMGEDGVIKYRDNEESISLENHLFHLPKLNGALHGLHSQQPSFGPTCCLVKRWLSAHLLDASHFPEIVVELLVAAMYLNPDPYKPAQIPQTAFIRILQFFAREAWSTDPVIVNFNGEMTREEVVAVENHFGETRETLPPLFISTPYDHNKSIWTGVSPSILVLNRVASLAKEVLKLVERELFESSFIVWEPMFRPTTGGYDILIHVKAELNARRPQALDLDGSLPQSKRRPYKPHPNVTIPIIGFNPVDKYLEELRNNYGAFALFFHDTYGGSVIGVLMKPTELEKREFKVPNVNCRRIDGSGKLVLNVPAMIEDFSLLGHGLVENIDVQSKNIKLN
ncbi:nucleolar protein 6 [Fopius arisanus]|uniref:Nucleolar protein 6 n=1 Tax=Fopius arisanus TaxID=64838 RepID=A0A9R1T4J5_9HYME|nr:PREDICTED: nucleolar protein 6 [Fopius arisanus]